MNWAIPNHQRVLHVATHLRQSDAWEVFCSHGLQPVDAVMQSWRSSPDCRSIVGDDGSPVGIAGVSTGGVIWLLATDGLLATASHRRQFIRGAREWVDGLLRDGAGPLHNWVMASNHTTVQWLRSLGFDVEPPRPMGPRLELFSYVERAE